MVRLLTSAAALVATLALTGPAPAAAAPGDLVTTWGTGGRVITTFGNGSVVGYAIAPVPSSSRFFVAGHEAGYGAALVKYKADGTRDTTFDGDGIVTTPFSGLHAPSTAIYAMAIERSTGKIVVAGVGRATDTAPRSFLVARYLPSGALDPSFDGDGFRTFEWAGYGSTARSVALSGDKIVVSGDGDDLASPSTQPDRVQVLRLGADGAPDASFSSDGRAEIEVTAQKDHEGGLAVDPDGRVLVGSYVSGETKLHVLRLRATGALDSAFSGDGKAQVDYGPGMAATTHAVRLQGTGVLVAGAVDGQGAIARLKTDGSPDTGFGGAGSGRRVIPHQAEPINKSFVLDIQEDPNGKLVLAGGAWPNSGGVGMWLARLRPTGEMDTTFGDPDGSGPGQPDGQAYLVPREFTIGPDTYPGSGSAYGATFTSSGDIILGGVEFEPPDKSNVMLSRWEGAADVTKPLVAISKPVADAVYGKETAREMRGTASLGATDRREVEVRFTKPAEAAFLQKFDRPVDEQGRWSHAGWTLPDGDYRVEVRQRDEAGNEGTTGLRAFRVRTQGPVGLTLTSPAGGDPTLAFRRPAFSGKASLEPGAKREVLVAIRDRGGFAANTGLRETVTAPVDPVNGSWTAVAKTDLPDGAYEAAAVQSDASDNRTTTAPVLFRISVPVAPTRGTASISGGLADGTGEVLRELTAEVTGLDGSEPRTLSYTWFSCETRVSDGKDCTAPGDAQRFTPSPSDNGRFIRLSVLVSNSAGQVRLPIVTIGPLRIVASSRCAGLDQTADPDGDGLSNVLECNIVTFPGTGELDLPSLGADPFHKDMFVEVDVMTGQTIADAAIERVVAAFDAAPNKNPDGKTGIRLHVDAGAASFTGPEKAARFGVATRSNALPDDPVLGRYVGKDQDFNWGEIDTIKKANFAAERAYAFRYVIVGRRYGNAAEGSSGVARGLGATDLLITLEDFCKPAVLPCSGSVDEQTGTFMHEFGHTIGLGHGGRQEGKGEEKADNENRKPNYQSIMNYNWQLGGLRKDDGTQVWDFSRYGVGAPGGDLRALNEDKLDETKGLGSRTGGLRVLRSCYDSKGVVQLQASQAGDPIDFNCDGDTTDRNVKYDINRTWGKANAGVKRSYDTLLGRDDWNRLQFTAGSIGAAGASVGGAGDALVLDPGVPVTLPQATANLDADADPEALQSAVQAATGDRSRPRVRLRIVRRPKGAKGLRLRFVAVDERRLQEVVVTIGKATARFPARGKRLVKAFTLPKGRYRVNVIAYDTTGNQALVKKRFVVRR